MTLAGIALLATALMASSASAASSAAAIEEHIKHADTYYWFAMAEKGNVRAFRRGLEHLAEAERLLDAGGLPQGTAARLRRRIDALRGDITNQGDVHCDTLYGMFPLVRLLVPSLFADALANGTFELVDDPDVIASTSGALSMVTQVIEEWKDMPQLHAMLVSRPANEALENECLYVFNSSPKFYMHNRGEVTGILTGKELDAARAGPLDASGRRRLLSAFGSPRMLLVNVRELDVVGDDYFYQVDGDLYEAGEDAPTWAMKVMGFCRDRRSALAPIVGANVILLAIAFASFVFLVKMRTSEFPGVGEAILAPLVAFALGRTIPWIVVPLVGSVIPRAEDLAKLTFWWPCAMGGGLVLGPALVYRIASARLQRIVPGLAMDGKGGAVLLAVGLGVGAYMAGPLLLLNGADAAWCVPALVLGAGAATYVLGRTLDRADPYPLHSLVLPAVAAFGIGAAYCSAWPAAIWAAGLASVALAVAHGVTLLLLHRFREDTRKRQDGSRESTDEGQDGSRKDTCGRKDGDIADGAPADLWQLADRAASPEYVRFGVYDAALEKVAPAVEGRVAWLALVGSRGIGKTATANALVGALRKLAHDRKINVALLAGECPEDMKGTPAYAPFRQALARHFEVNLLGASEGQLEQIDSALDGLFESLVPFSGLLFPPAEGSQNSPQTKAHVFKAIARAIGRLAAKRLVVLSIDDVQWMDGASFELLESLLAEFPQGHGTRLAVIVSGHEPERFAKLGMADHRVPLQPLRVPERTSLLVKSLGIVPADAQIISEKVGEGCSGQGELHWLLQVVAHFARSGVFRKTEKGFAFAPGHEGGKNLPIPGEYRTALEHQLREHSAYRPLLECAACLGREFSVKLLASSLERPHLEILQMLHRIEDDTGIVHDVKESDDVFAFRSSFMLEMIRESMKISGLGPRTSTVPQIVREYHSRLAKSLMKSLDESSGALFDVARHLFAAGMSRASEALEQCLKAARAASAIFDHTSAREFVNMARECALAVGRDAQFEEELLKIDCHEAHVEGKGNREAAQRWLDYLKTHPEAPAEMLLLGARTCYDAAAGDRDQAMFAQAVELGRLAIKRDGATVLEEAEGHHFVGISLGPPQDRREEREKELRQAMSLVANADHDDLPAQALRGRIANSLGEQLSCYRRDDAKKMYDLSLEIKQRKEMLDLSGIARAYGGLGRLAWFGKPRNIQEARRCFMKDLEISEQIGDRSGQSQMHSFIGGCDLAAGNETTEDKEKKERFESATRHYIASRDIAERLVDKFFAGAGLLECLHTAGDRAGIDRHGIEILELARKAGLPDDPAGALIGALKKCAKLASGSWHTELTDLAKKATKGSGK